MTITLSPGQDKDFDADNVYYPTGDGKPMAESDLHQNQMFYIIFALRAHYQNDPKVYVAGNNFLYYERGNPRAVISPDGYVVFGVDSHLRDTYKLWLEGGILPSVIFEVTSKTTRREDVRKKRPLYETTLRVGEYFQFDPTGDYLTPRLQGLRLIDGQYQPIPLIEGRMHSEQLGLDLVYEGKYLRLFDPTRGVFLWSPEETTIEAERQTLRANQEAQRAEQEAQRANQQTIRAEQQTQRAEQEMRRAEQEAQRAEQEAQARLESEADNARLRAELDALRRQRTP